MSKMLSFMRNFGSQHVNGSQTLLRSPRNHLYTTIPLICGRTIRKRLVLVIFEVLGQFFNTLTSDCKYSRSNMENLPQEVQIDICLKPKTFSWLLIAFLKSPLIFSRLKKNQFLRLSLTEIIYWETGKYLNV